MLEEVITSHTSWFGLDAHGRCLCLPFSSSGHLELRNPCRKSLLSTAEIWFVPQAKCVIQWVIICEYRAVPGNNEEQFTCEGSNHTSD